MHNTHVRIDFRSFHLAATADVIVVKVENVAESVGRRLDGQIGVPAAADDARRPEDFLQSAANNARAAGLIAAHAVPQ